MRYGRCAERLSSPRRGRCTMRAFAWGRTHALLSARGGLPASPCATTRRHLNRIPTCWRTNATRASTDTWGSRSSGIPFPYTRSRCVRTIVAHARSPPVASDRACGSQAAVARQARFRMAAAFRFLVEPAMIGGSSRSTRAGTRCRVSARDRLIGGRDDAHRKPSFQNTTRDPVHVRMPGLHAGRCDYARRGAPSLRKSGK